MSVDPEAEPFVLPMSERSLDYERRLIDIVRAECDDRAFKMVKHTVTTDEEKGKRKIVLTITRDLTGQGHLPFTTEREQHPDNA